MHCNVCNTNLRIALYESQSKTSLTSLCELRQERVRIWFCHECGHLRGEVLRNTREYYESEYRILLDHDDEDQIYEVCGDNIIYRTDHQVATLISKLNLPYGARMLDYGCAKASTPRRLLDKRPDLEIYLFDVSTMYTRYWQKFLPEGRWAIDTIPDNWHGQFDVVTSFFALEHMPEPLDAVQKIASLIKEDGVFYGIVPNVFSNISDFVVVDHVNHFTDTSLFTLLRKAGFVDICIDANAHRGAWVFTAKKTGKEFPLQSDVTTIYDHSCKLSLFWSNLNSYIRSIELRSPGLKSAIYGSGFYGAYIATLLQNLSNVVCFLDASPYRQGKSLFGLPILIPNQLPGYVKRLYIGLNPVIARSEVSKMTWLNGRDLQIVYIDDPLP